jgi:hypothetical protein
VGRRWDRFLVHTRVGGSRKIRRLAPAERWALVAGAWALAAESPTRGALLIAEGCPVTVEDVAEHAGVTTRVAKGALSKARTLGLLVKDDDGVEWVHDWHDWNPDPKPSDTPEATRARKRAERERKRAKANGHASNVTPMSRVTSHDVTPAKEGKERTA